MLSKTQKILLSIFGAMFVVPEVLFWFTPLSILSLMNHLSGSNVKPLVYFFINSLFFTDHPAYLFIAIIIEWLGVFGLLAISLKAKERIIPILLGVMILWLSFIILLGYVVSQMGFNIG